MSRLALAEERGFTLIEVMVAALVLVVGMLGVLSSVLQAQTGTWSTQARTGANALAREVVEGVRLVPYEQLNSQALVAALQSQVGLVDDQPGVAGWQVRRGGFTYTLSVGACAVDDPRDGLGNHDPGVFCASGASGTPPAVCANLLSLGAGGSVGLPGAGVGAAGVAGLGDCGLDVNFDGQADGLVDTVGSACVGTCAAGGVDPSPADYKRVVVLVRWDRGMGSRYVLEGTAVVNPGFAAAPAISTISSSTASPVTAAATTSLQLTGTASAPAATVAAYLDGTQVGTATSGGGSWSFTWPLGAVSSGSAPGPGEVVDGSYLVGLKAFDANGQFGQSRSLTILVNRRAPYPPQQLLAGRSNGVVNLEWQPNPERDIQMYRGYRAVGGGWTLVCQSVSPSCQDPAPPPTGTPSYTVVAVDRDPSGNLREGAQAAIATVPLVDIPPNPPTNLTASTVATTTVLNWTAPALSSVDHYMIYRDGATYADRYDRTADATTTWTDTHVDGASHTYVVTAVDAHLAESSPLGPVTG